MKGTFLSIALVATSLLFGSADAFAQRSRGGGHLGGPQGGSSGGSYSSSGGGSSSSSGGSTECKMGGQSGSMSSALQNGNYSLASWSLQPSWCVIPKVYLGTNFENHLMIPDYGKVVSKRTATRRAQVIRVLSGEYYYRDGIFYYHNQTPYNESYEIQKPLSGFHVSSLPSSKEQQIVDGVTYYYYYGSFFAFEPSSKQYVVVTPPIGAIVTCVPQNSFKYDYEGITYYVNGDVQYKAFLKGSHYEFEIVEKTLDAVDLKLVCGVVDIESSSEKQYMYPHYGEVVSKRTATKKSKAILGQTGLYYYRDGIFYLKDNDKYVIHAPNVGLHVPSLPESRRVFVLDGKSYYYCYGSFYTYQNKSNDFMVVVPPVGAVVEWIPSGSEKVEIDGDVYYIVSGVQYKSIKTDGKMWYEVVFADEKLYSQN